MVIPVQVTFRNMSSSDALETAIREKAAKLDRLHPRIIMGCRVAVEAERHRHMKGSVFRVRIDLTVAQGEIVASGTTTLPAPHENAYLAVNEAFDDIRRRLDEYTQRLRGDVKAHGSRRTG